MKSAFQILIKKPVSSPGVASHQLYNYITLDSYFGLNDHTHSKYRSQGHAEVMLKELRNHPLISGSDEFTIVEVFCYSS